MQIRARSHSDVRDIFNRELKIYDDDDAENALKQ